VLFPSKGTCSMQILYIKELKFLPFILQKEKSAHPVGSDGSNKFCMDSSGEGLQLQKLFFNCKSVDLGPQALVLVVLVLKVIAVFSLSTIDNLVIFVRKFYYSFN
jgi:hypothetical protein